MNDKQVNLYPLLDQSTITFFERSVFYNISPIGVGTPAVEALTSFICRLAQVHGVSVKTLVTLYLFPYFSQIPTPSVVGYKNNLWIKNAYLLNNMGEFAFQCVNGLTQLTSSQELKYLTLLPWCTIFSYRRQEPIRVHRAWCPACYEYWKDSEAIIYDPLLWSIDNIHICIIHGCPLTTRCPYCSKNMFLLGEYARPGHCFHCIQWLGKKYTMNGDLFHESENDYNIWVNYTVGQLIGSRSVNSEDITKRKLINNINILISKRYKQLYSMDPYSIWLLSQGCPFSLRVFVSLSNELNIPLLVLLTDEVS